jgi:very-short-patch-repair endonuclease
LRAGWRSSTGEAPQGSPPCEGSSKSAEVDFAYPKEQVAIQCVSKRHHSGFSARTKDDDQSSWLASLGWRVFVWSASDLNERPDELVRRLRNGLALRGSR